MLLAFSAICLGFSYYFEFWGHLKPCRLCLIQRYSYVGLFVFGALVYTLQWNEIFRKLILIILSAGFIVATYHTLIHFGVVASKCSREANTADVTAFMQWISQPTSCSDKTFTILGIPLPCINASIFLFSALITLRAKRQPNPELSESDASILPSSIEV